VEVSYPVMYGFCTNLLNIGKKEALSAVTYSAASSIIKTVQNWYLSARTKGRRFYSMPMAFSEGFWKEWRNWTRNIWEAAALDLT